MSRTCSFVGCDRPLCARGLCNSHWAQQSRGHSLTPIRTRETIEERFDRHIEVADDGCWIWTGGASGKDAHRGGGYGQIYWKGTKRMAHRFSYEYYVRPLELGEQVDHLCRNTRCCNPDHLEAVTSYENMRRLRFANVMQARILKLESFIIDMGYDPDTI